MSSKQWINYKWGKLCTLEYGKGLKDYRESTGKTLVYGTNGPIGFTEKELSNRDGVIIGRKGAYRGVHYSPKPFFVIDTAFYLNIIDDSKLDMKFAYYNLLTKDINSMDSGSAIPSTSRNDFYNIESNLPSIEEQKAIAHVLSTLDGKIDINNQINKKLEEMAQAIFKQWFVDFEFSNENGEPYKSSGGEMVESEMGMIPKGWQHITLGDVVDSANTGADAIRRAPIVEYDTGIKCARVGDLSNGRDVSSWAYCEVSDKDYEKFALKKNDILITRTATIGLNMLVYEEIKAVFNNGLIRIKVNDEYNPLFIYQVLNYKDYYNHISKITGETSTRPNMKINYLLNYKFILPSKTISNKFEKTINPIVYKINQNNEENKILAITRETLLPKLMSGEIRVPISN